MVSQLTGIFEAISPVSHTPQGNLTQSFFLSLLNVITPTVAEMPLKHVKRWLHASPLFLDTFSPFSPSDAS